MQAVAFFDFKSSVEWFKVGDRAVDAPRGFGVWVGERRELFELRPGDLALHLGKAEEKALLRRKTGDNFPACLFEMALVCLVGYDEPSHIGHVLAKRQLAVDVHTGLDLDLVGLRYKRPALAHKTFAVGGGPPALHITLGVEL